MSKNETWILSFTREGQAGREVGRYQTRDDALLAAQRHFDSLTNTSSEDDDELGWQMSFNGATALSDAGTYRVRRA